MISSLKFVGVVAKFTLHFKVIAKPRSYQNEGNRHKFGTVQSTCLLMGAHSNRPTLLLVVKIPIQIYLIYGNVVQS